MSYEPKNGSGAIFKNKNKKADNHPDYTGNFKGLDGTMYNAALWVKKDKNGNSYFSFSQSEFRANDTSEKLPF